MLQNKRKVYCKLFLFSGAIFIIIYSFVWGKYVWRKNLEKDDDAIHVIPNYPLMTEKPWNKGRTETKISRLRERQKKREKTLEKNFKNLKEDGGIHVITNFPLMTEKPWNEGQTETKISRLWERQEELEETLEKNLNHSLVKAVHVLVNQPSAEQRLKEQNFHNKHKIVVHRINALPKYRDFFDYANKTLQNKLVIMMNMDIYLGEGFEMINKTFLVKSKISYILTRHGRQEKRCNMAGKLGYCGVSYFGSHDAYIFVLTQPLDESVLAELDYDMNVLGAENKLIWLLGNQLKRRLLNPCKYLKTYHNHCVDIHGSVRPRIDGKGGMVPESELY